MDSTDAASDGNSDQSSTDAALDSSTLECPTYRPNNNTTCDYTGPSCQYPSTIGPSNVICLCTGNTWHCYE
jgi:hypothetical protein